MAHPASQQPAGRGKSKRTGSDHTHQEPAYARLLGIRAHSVLALTERVEQGLSYKALERFQKTVGLSMDRVAELVQIPPRTLSRRKDRGKLKPDESDRLLRVSRIYARALELFEGSTEATTTWLSAPLTALGGHSPFDFARTELGAREVENVIGRLEYGVAV
jgi:putative toxin-antitoxin system antitoxin component (TIGR02293 family)